MDFSNKKSKTPLIFAFGPLLSLKQWCKKLRISASGHVEK